MITDTTSRVTLLAPPVEEPLTLSETKAFLRIEHSSDDAAIAVAVGAARQCAEDYLGLVLLPQRYVFEFCTAAHIVKLPRGPAQEVEEILAYDGAGQGTAVNGAAYRLTMDGHGLVFSSIPNGQSFAVEYEAGQFAAPTAVPAPLKQGMLHHVAAMLEQRVGEAGMPRQSVQLYQPYRRVRL